VENEAAGVVESGRSPHFDMTLSKLMLSLQFVWDIGLVRPMCSWQGSW
jgi:hypothetical protein